MKTRDGDISEKFIKCGRNTVTLQCSGEKMRFRNKKKNEGGSLRGDRIEGEG